MLVSLTGINLYRLKFNTCSFDGCRHWRESQLEAKVGGQRRRCSRLGLVTALEQCQGFTALDMPDGAFQSARITGVMPIIVKVMKNQSPTGKPPKSLLYHWL